MRRLSSKRFLVALILSLGIFFVMPHFAFAQAPNVFDRALAGAANLVLGSFDAWYGFLARILYYAIATPLSWVLFLSGNIMDLAIKLSLTATELFNSPAISIGWKAIRDIFNIFFIFSLIYISIATIIGAGGYKTSESLKNVIIAAVLINFSLYFTKVIIDISNIFAVWMYSAIEGLTPGESGISSTIRSMFAVEKMFSTKKIDDLSAFAAIFAVAFLYIASIKVFLEIAFLFITRTIMFVFLLILSPIGFMGDVLPKLKEESKRWWSELMGQALVAPVFLLLLYITLLFVSHLQGSVQLLSGQSTTATDPITKSDFTFVDYAIFFLIYFMIKKCLEITKAYSGKTGDAITGVIKGAVGFAVGGVAMGTIGRVASLAAKSEAVASLVKSDSFAGRVAGRTILSASNNIASKNFGMTAGLKESGLDKVLPKSAFKGADKGYAGKVKQDEKDQKEFAKTFGKGVGSEIARQKYAQDLAKREKMAIWDRVIGGGIGASVATVGGVLRAKGSLSVGEGFIKGLKADTGTSDSMKKDADSALKKESKKEAQKVEGRINADSALQEAKKKLEKLAEEEKGTLESLEHELEEARHSTGDMTSAAKSIEKLEERIKLAREKARLSKEIEERRLLLLKQEIEKLFLMGIKFEEGVVRNKESGKIDVDIKKAQEELRNIIKRGEAEEKKEKEDKLGKLLEEKEPEEKPPTEEPKTKPNSE